MSTGRLFQFLRLLRLFIGLAVVVVGYGVHELDASVRTSRLRSFDSLIHWVRSMEQFVTSPV